MKILHLLPGESRGDTAQIILTSEAVAALRSALETVSQRGYAHARFLQRDGEPFTLTIELNDAPPRSHAWRAHPLSYMLGRRRNEANPLQGAIDLDLLATHLYTARRTRRHNQRQAARSIGVSLGFISGVENQNHTPKPENLLKLCAYIGQPPELFINPEGDP